MTQQASLARSRERLAPLLRSIQREITERVQRVRVLERRRKALAATRRAHAEELARLESEISTHRRELRRIEQELSRLGVPFDAENPSAVFKGTALERTDETSLEDTGFRPRLADSRT